MRAVGIVGLSLLWMGACGSDSKDTEVVCVQDQTRCRHNQVETCAHGLWQTTKDCGSRTCVAGVAGAACQLSDACAAGDSQCRGSLLEVCQSDGTWLMQEDCAPVAACVENSPTKASCQIVPVCDSTQKSACQGSKLYDCHGSHAALRVDCQDFNGSQGTCFDYEAPVFAECLFPLGEFCAFEVNQQQVVWGCGADQPLSSMACDIDSQRCIALKKPCLALSVGLFCDDDVLVTCTAKGGNYVANAKPCGKGLCGEVQGKADCLCEEDATRCSGYVLEKCEGGVWSAVRSCRPGICMAVTATEAECR